MTRRKGVSLDQSRTGQERGGRDEAAVCNSDRLIHAVGFWPLSGVFLPSSWIGSADLRRLIWHKVSETECQFRSELVLYLG